MKNDTNQPKVSIMLCVYNAQAFISESINSIFQQSFQDYEVVIVDDGSNDETMNIINAYGDKRIRLIHNKHDYIGSLNKGLKACRGRYIARMDADDIMLPSRIETQMNFMEAHHDIAVCFSWAALFGANDGTIGVYAREQINDANFWLLTGNLFIHPTAMLRTEFIRNNGLRYKRYQYAEDYKLWSDIARLGGGIYVIPKVLLNYRVSHNQVSYKHHQEQKNTKLRIQQEIAETLINCLPVERKNDILRTFNNLLKLNNQELLQGDEVISFMFRILHRIYILT